MRRGRVRDDFRSEINIMKHIIELSERPWNHELNVGARVLVCIRIWGTTLDI